MVFRERQALALEELLDDREAVAPAQEGCSEHGIPPVPQSSPSLQFWGSLQAPLAEQSRATAEQNTDGEELTPLAEQAAETPSGSTAAKRPLSEDMAMIRAHKEELKCAKHFLPSLHRRLKRKSQPPSRKVLQLVLERLEQTKAECLARDLRGEQAVADCKAAIAAPVLGRQQRQIRRPVPQPRLTAETSKRATGSDRAGNARADGCRNPYLKGLGYNPALVSGDPALVTRTRADTPGFGNRMKSKIGPTTRTDLASHTLYSEYQQNLSDLSAMMASIERELVRM